MAAGLARMPSGTSRTVFSQGRARGTFSTIERSE